MSTESKERPDFEEWWERHGSYNIPEQEDVPPKLYRMYKSAARIAWTECACRKNMEIFRLKLQDHEIAKLVTKVTHIAEDHYDKQSLRELMSQELVPVLKGMRT